MTDEKECIITIKEKVDTDSDAKEICHSSPEKLDSSLSRNQITNSLEILKKLEIVKEIKNKTLNLQRVKSKLSHEIDCIETEEKQTVEFKTELDLLCQERVALLDELRQIDSDISTMEKTIKQSDQEKRRALESTKRLKVEYKPLKDQINHLRESIGLVKTEENEDEIILEHFLSKLTTEDSTTSPKYSLGIDRLINNKTPNTNSSPITESKQNTKFREGEQGSAFSSAIKSNSQVSNHSFFLSQMDLPVQLATAALMAHSLRNNRPPSPQIQPAQPAPQFTHYQQQQQQNTFNQFIHQMNSSNHDNLSNQTNQEQLQLQQPQFRQQPPPMKSCLSCNQQIHRNAPICPLCKAKSRSRNPKKPKKKSSQTPDSLSPEPKNTNKR